MEVIIMFKKIIKLYMKKLHKVGIIIINKIKVKLKKLKAQ